MVLLSRVHFLEEITITPGLFAIAQGEAAKRQAIEKERIAAIPATLDDIYRVLQLMPGVTFSDDYSAHFHVRGGEQNENLILLDGIEIYDPYHLKNIGGAVGVMNMEIIDKMAIMTGGFEARYGDRLSSVVAIENRNGHAERLTGSLGAGGTGISLLLESPLPHGSGLISFRKSFLKEAAELLNPTSYTFAPSFYDLQAKVALSVTPRHQLQYTLLYSRDNSYLEQWRGDRDLYADYGNAYHGFVWKYTAGANLYAECIASFGENFWNNRSGESEKEHLDLNENTCSGYLNGFPHPRHELSGGLSFKQITYSCEIETGELSTEQQELEDLVQSYFGSQTISQHTWKLAGFIQDKYQLSGRLSMNAGLRYDYFEYNDDQQTSPRVGLAFRLNDNTLCRAAWGHYFQAPLYAELTNSKGAGSNPRAQKSTHYVLGMERYFSPHLSLRIESYYKTLERMIGHYFTVDAQSGQPELRYGNPYSGSCRGIELFLQGRLSASLFLWATYAYSRATLEASFVNWQKAAIEKKTIPRFTDQPHNLSLFVSWRLPRKWELNLKWRYLSGIPYTPMSPLSVAEGFRWQYSEPYSARYPAYQRLDLRLGKNLIAGRFRIATFLEVKNLCNHRNVLLYDYRIENGQPVRKAYYTLPLLPTIEGRIAF
jgi:outer membrane receptor protein involved in Fe transport